MYLLITSLKGASYMNKKYFKTEEIKHDQYKLYRNSKYEP